MRIRVGNVSDNTPLKKNDLASYDTPNNLPVARKLVHQRLNLTKMFASPTKNRSAKNMIYSIFLGTVEAETLPKKKQRSPSSINHIVDLSPAHQFINRSNQPRRFLALTKIRGQNI